MNIFVIYASAGAGHFKAAEALYDGLKKHTSHEVVLADALDYTSPFFKAFYRRSYVVLVTQFPSLWGFFFRLFDAAGLQPLLRIFRRMYNGWNARRLHDFLKTRDFDYIFSTHFMPSEVVAAVKQAGRIRSKLITVVTDFDAHKIWLNPATDFYTVASEWTKEKLKRLGVEEGKIRACGIPTHEQFAVPADRGQLKRKLGLKEDAFTVLAATGSFGIGPMEELLDAMPEFQTVVVCGHNQALFRRLTRKNYPSAKILGLVDNMPELMAVADVMVTKPGGLSIAEALVRQLPMIFFHSIPGQEMSNVRVLQEHGIGTMAADVPAIVREVKKLHDSRDLYLTALKQTHRLARPSAVRDIISLIK